MRILVIDDDECQLRWCVDQLEKLGFQTETALSGQDGLHLYQTRGPWDFVLSDYMFFPSEQVKDGLDLVRKIRDLKPDQAIAIHTSEKGLQSPVPVLHKPYQIGELLRLLMESVKDLTLLPK